MLPAGTRLGSYQILGALGAGGMGEVYRARDTRLGRDVALKLLPPELTSEAGRLERFDREARAIAALNHPHIVTIYSTEEADGARFITMELVEGQTLTELITPGGVSVTKLLEIGVPLADALTAAHQRQITHRDLKPANVMVSHDGRVKVLDFGLARIGRTDTAGHSMATMAPVTQHGMIVGTMPYMSPEQIEGVGLDERSDLFSLGVILYELLTGERPFQGTSSPALMSAILRDTAAPLSAKRADLPESLTRLVTRCLEKRREDRVQTARDVYNELRHLQKQLESGSSSRAHRRAGAIVAATTESLSIAVLPFSVRGTDPDADAIATGLTEDITASLAKFPGLSVIALQSARVYKDSTLDARQIAERLNARYIVTGGIRKAGPALRVTTTVVDAESAATLWSESYDRRMAAGDIFAVQDDLTDHIVATLADKHGVLAQSMVQSVRQQTPLDRSTAGDLVLRAWGFHRSPTAAGHAELRDAFESRLAAEPDNPHLLGNLAHLYLVEHSLWFNQLPDALGRAQRASRRAIEIDPNNQQGWETLAMACFYAGDRGGLQEAAERAIRINPRNAYTMAWMGAMFGKAGEYDRGCALVERAMQINPNHPGWLHFTIFDRHFARGEFVEALAAAKRVNNRDFMWMHFAIAAAAGQLGLAEGRGAYDAMLRLAPAFADEPTLREFVRRWYWPPEMIESLLQGVAQSRSSSIGATTLKPSAAIPASSATSLVADTIGISISSFAARGGDDATALAEGLAEDISTGLSRFGHLRVHARDTRFVVEGSVRQAGSSLRVSTRIVDTELGTSVWADNFDREATAGVFALQDDLASRIVATIGDHTGVLTAAIAAASADKPVEQLTVAELVVRFDLYTAQLRRAEHAVLREAFEHALQRERGAATSEGWACLAHLYGQEHALRMNPLPDSLKRERHAAERAVELNPQSQRPWVALARAHFFARDLPAMRGAIERALSINPLSADMLAHCALFLSGAGDDDRAVELTRRAASLKPHHHGWYHFPAFNAHYSRREYAEALKEAKQANMPLLPLANLSALAAAGQLGLPAEARASMENLRQHGPDFLEPVAARREWGIWLWRDTLLDQLVDGMKKALACVDASPGRPPAAPASDAGSSAFTVTVLPFHASTSANASALAEGLRDSIAVGLSRFAYLRVITRAVSAEKVGSGYTLQATVRESAGVIRVVTQLSDISTGASVWADTYDRVLSDPHGGSSRPTSLFDIQDDLTATIVATIADSHGALVRSMAAAVRNTPIEALTPYEAVLRRFAYISIMSPSEHALVRAALEKAVERAPGFALAWAVLSQVYVDEFVQGFNPLPAPMERARAAADKALEIDASCHAAHVSLSAIGFFSRDVSLFRAAADRALALNPFDTATMSWLGTLMSYLGEYEQGLALSARARALNPHHPGVYWMAEIVDHYRRRDYDGALAILNRVNMPAYPNALIMRATIYGQLGRLEEGRQLVQEAEARMPGISARDNAPRLRWFSRELLEHIQDGLDKLQPGHS